MEHFKNPSACRTISRPLDFDGAIFDLDGTLLDSLWIWREVDEIFLNRRGIAVPPDYMATVMPLGFRETAEYTIRRFGLSDRPEDLMEEWNRLVEEAYRERIGLKPFAYEYLRSLRERGVRLGVATSMNPAFCDPVLRRNGIGDWFDGFAYSHEVGRGKGFPDIYERAAERIGVSPERCLVFEDIPVAVRGAKAGGFIVCGVYDAINEAGQAELQSLSDLYIRSFEELLEKK